MMSLENSESVKKITVLDRILLLITGLLAAWQVGFGINDLGLVPEIGYTVAFGVLLVAGLLIILLGFEVLDSPLVLVAATIIPLSMSLGLVAQFYPDWLMPYAIFVALAFLAILVTRFAGGKGIKVGAIIVGHGISGMVIFLLPLILSFGGRAPGLFFFAGVGGALIGVGGILLSFLKMGKPIFSRNTILTILPGLLLIMMVCFTVGFSALTR